MTTAERIIAYVERMPGFKKVVAEEAAENHERQRRRAQRLAAARDELMTARATHSAICVKARAAVLKGLEELQRLGAIERAAVLARQRATSDLQSEIDRLEAELRASADPRYSEFVTQERARAEGVRLHGLAVGSVTNPLSGKTRFESNKAEIDAYLDRVRETIRQAEAAQLQPDLDPTAEIARLRQSIGEVGEPE